MAKVQLTLTGTSPLLMHNARLSDPFDEVVREMKAISGKRKKTDEDHLELARLEFAGGLYHDADLGPYIPGENIQRCIQEAAKLTREGKQVERGMLVLTDVNPLIYRGPRDITTMWEDKNFVLRKSVKVTTSRIIRTRPMFTEWQADCEIQIDTSMLEMKDVQRFADAAGSFVGIGDWRPRYGRFTGKVKAIK